MKPRVMIYPSQSQSPERESFNISYINPNFGSDGEVQSMNKPRQKIPLKKTDNSPLRGQRAEVEYLMDKLLNEQQRVMDLEEQITKLKSELREKQSDSNKPKIDSQRSSAVPPSEEFVLGEPETPKEELSSVLNLPGEARSWNTASLPQLLDARKQMISSMYTISDLITNKRLLSKGDDKCLDDMQEEYESAIEASMYRLHGEAFHVKTIQDTKELHSLAESVCGIEEDVFSSSLFSLAILTENGSLAVDNEKQQQFLNDPLNGMTPDWCKRYTSAMRQLIVSFLMNSQSILASHRTDLEKIARHELAHIVFLRAAQGRPVIPWSTWYLSPGYVVQHPDERKTMAESTSRLSKSLRAGRSQHSPSHRGPESPRLSGSSTVNSMSQRLNELLSLPLGRSINTQPTPSRRRALKDLDLPPEYHDRGNRTPQRSHGTPFASNQQKQIVRRSGRCSDAFADAEEIERMGPLVQLSLSARPSKRTPIRRTTPRRQSETINGRASLPMWRRTDKHIDPPDFAMSLRSGSTRRCRSSRV